MSGTQRTWTLDDSTRASNAGGLRVKPLVWLAQYPAWPIAWLALLAVALVFALFLHWSLWIAVAIAGLMNLLYWRRVKDHFFYGALNPAVVVSIDPPLIAVMSDLSSGNGRYPVLKVIRKDLPPLEGTTWAPGTALATVSLYARHRDENMPRWADFDPRPAVCATDDAAAIRAMMQRIPPEEWDELATALKQLPRPFAVGTFHLFEDA